MESLTPTLVAPCAVAAVAGVSPGPESRAAAARVAAEMAALDDSEIEQVNVDVTLAVTQLLGHWENLVALDADIAALPGSQVERIRSLRDYALALYHWQSCALFSVASDPELAALVDRGIVLRDRTLADLTALAAHGLVDAASLANYRGTTGYRKVALDLAGLANLVRERWSVLGGRTLLTLEAMDELAMLGEQILAGVGERDRAPATSAAAVRQRDRAFTLFLRGYRAARRALAYLRDEQDDVDRILPSLYPGRRIGRARNATREVEATQAEPARSGTVSSTVSAPASTLVVPREPAGDSSGPFDTSSPFESV